MSSKSRSERASNNEYPRLAFVSTRLAGTDGVSLEAVVTFVIDSRYDEIPDDSDASALTAGLLGAQYIGLQAGGSDMYLEDGSEILFTQSAIVLENLIGKFLVNAGSGGEE